MYQIGIDVGGTFTDFVLHNDETGETRIHKLPSTPEDPSRAAIAGIQALSAREGFDPAQLNRVVHGTTIATNIILQRNGARVGLITTEGFRDILHIGRKKRPLNFSNYQDVPRQTAPLVPRRLRLTVPERIRAPDGAVEVPLDEDAARRALRRLAGEGVDAIAVALLFAFLNPDHENRVRELAAEECPGVFVTCSHEVSPLHREYERFSTTALNAYVGPATATYTARFSESLSGLGVRSDLRLMTSAGGLIGSRVAMQRPVSLLASGPVGALIKGIDIGRSIGHPGVITLDVGGTSADVGVARDGALHLKHVLDTRIGDYDAMVPMVDVNSIGAGGGSVAIVDEAGMFQVGPRSAGAVPGPACYGLGGAEPTVTDALVFLGWFRPETLESSGIAIDPALAEQAIRSAIAEPLGLPLEDAALGIYRIACRHMIDAIRLGSVSKGYDPRDFVLVAFGGAGAAFAAEIARELGIPEAVVPPHPGVGAAAGLLSTDIRYDFMASHWADLPEADLAAVAEKYRMMAARARRELAGDGFTDEAVTVAFHADCRYKGQGYELGVAVPADFGDGWKEAVAEAFHRAHERHYLRRFADATVQVVNLRAVGVGRIAAPGEEFPGRGTAAESAGSEGTGSEDTGSEPEEARIGVRAAIFPAGDGWVRANAAVYRRARLTPGAVVGGPAIVEQEDTTILVPPDFRATADRHGNLAIAERR